MIKFKKLNKFNKIFLCTILLSLSLVVITTIKLSYSLVDNTSKCTDSAKCVSLCDEPKDKTFKVMFNTNSSIVLNAIRLATVRKNGPTLATLKKDGYVFAGWYYDAKFTKMAPYDSDELVTTEKKDAYGCTIGWNDIILYARWKSTSCPKFEDKSTFKVVFDTTGGEALNAVRVSTYSISALPNPVKKGYIFAGWYLDAKFVNRFNEVELGNYYFTKTNEVYDAKGCFVENSNLKLYAKWTKQTDVSETPCKNSTILDATYKILFNTSSTYIINAIRVNAATKLPVASTQTILPTPTKFGYVFEGWYYDTAFTRKAPSNMNQIVTTSKYDVNGCQIGWNDLYLYAKWKKDESCANIPKGGTYKLIFETNGGKQIDTVNLNIASRVTLPTPIKTNFKFAGWYYDTENKKPVSDDFDTLISSSKHPIVADAKGCFVNWADITIYARWTSISEGCLETSGGTFMLIYNTNGGNIISAVRLPGIRIAEESTNIPTPVKKGYSFAGWYYDEKLTQKAPSNTGAVKTSQVEDINGCKIGWKNVTLYAKWTKNSSDCIEPTNGFFNIIFNTNGFANLNSMSLSTSRSGSSILPTPIGSKSYIFDGWYYDKEFTQKAPTNTLEIQTTRKYDSNKCLVGWNDVNLYAKGHYVGESCNSIESKEFTLGFNTNGGNNIVDANVAVNGTNSFDLPIPTKSGYTFQGWYYDSNFTKVAPANSSDIEIRKKYDSNYCYVGLDKITLYAKWINVNGKCWEPKEGNFNLSYNTNGGNYISDITLLTNGTNSFNLPTPTKSGYTFKGWYYDSNFVTKAPQNSKDIITSKIVDTNGCKVGWNNVTLYARWYTEKTAVITGIIKDAYGNPLSNYVVEMHSDIVSTITDENGMYRIENVDSGDHTLYVKDRGGNAISSSNIIVVENGDTDIDKNQLGYSNKNNKIELNIMLTELNEMAFINNGKRKFDISPFAVLSIIFALFLVSAIVLNNDTKKKV